MVALGEDRIDRAEHAGIQANHIAGHKLVGIDLDPASVDTFPNGRMVRLKHVPVEAALGFVFVEQAHQAADQPHQKQHGRCKRACLTLRLRYNVDQKGQASKCKQQRRKRIKERFFNHRSLFLAWLRLYPRRIPASPPQTLRLPCFYA